MVCFVRYQILIDVDVGVKCREGFTLEILSEVLDEELSFTFGQQLSGLKNWFVNFDDVVIVNSILELSSTSVEMWLAITEKY